MKLKSGYWWLVLFLAFAMTSMGFWEGPPALFVAGVAWIIVSCWMIQRHIKAKELDRYLEDWNFKEEK